LRPARIVEFSLPATTAKSAPILVETVEQVRAAVLAARQQGQSIGLVPTMGALHTGHVSLIEAARRDCEFVIVSIFVNPTQFGPTEDFQRYPRPLDTDLELCRQHGVDLVFHPSPATMYPPDFSSFVEVAGLSDVWEGRSRPGHFRGVSTVVLKLLTICLPDLAYFGQKDFQQQAIIRRMVTDLNLPCEVRVCPTIRDPDGLALSSRNAYLSESERVTALSLSRVLRWTADHLAAGDADLPRVRTVMQQMLRATPGLELDYATIVDSTTLQELDERSGQMTAIVAARVGKTRLIDNLQVRG
jgi:pantoate--beta-alanine ligase